MRKQNQSKGARKARKEALFAGLWRNFGHPSHVSGMKRFIRLMDSRIPDLLLYSQCVEKNQSKIGNF